MPLSKSVDVIDEWDKIIQNAVREGATYDVSGCYGASLHIDVALSSTTESTEGTKISVQISSHATEDDDWTTLLDFIGPTGTAASESLSGAEAIGQTVLEVGSTTGFEADESGWIFLEDTTTPANSEMLLLISHVSNTSITVLDGLTIAKDSADVLFNIAENYMVELPFSASRVRVIYDNTLHGAAAGPFVHTKCRISKVTGI